MGGWTHGGHVRHGELAPTHRGTTRGTASDGRGRGLSTHGVCHREWRVVYVGNGTESRAGLGERNVKRKVCGGSVWSKLHSGSHGRRETLQLWQRQDRSFGSRQYQDDQFTTIGGR